MAVIEARSISQAARDLHLTQPALSMKLKALEQELGAPLLTRSYDGVSPTPQGELAFDSARRVLEMCDAMMKAVRNCGSPPELNVGATPTMGGYILPYALGRFMVVHPSIRVNLTVSHLTGVIQQVSDGRLSIGFVEGLQSIPGLAAEDLGEDELRLIAPANWRGADEISEEQAFDLPHVLCIPECGMRQVLEKYLQSRGRTVAALPVVAQLDSLDAVKALVEGGAGVAWLSPRAISREIQAGSLRFLEVRGVQIPFNYVALYRKGQNPWPMSQHFINLVRERLRPHRRRPARAEV